MDIVYWKKTHVSHRIDKILDKSLYRGEYPHLKNQFLNPHLKNGF